MKGVETERGSTPRTAGRGRGAAANPANRFERIRYEPDPDWADASEHDEAPAPRTLFLRDPSKTAIAFNQSPDIGFDPASTPTATAPRPAP